MLLEWQSYEYILNLSYRELKEVVQSKNEPKFQNTKNNQNNNQIIKTKGESLPHSISSIPKDNKVDLYKNSDNTEQEHEKSDIMSLFETEEAQQFEIEFEKLRAQSSGMFEENENNNKQNTSDILVTQDFVDSLIPEMSVNPNRYESLDQIENALEFTTTNESIGETKLIAEILQQKLNSLDSVNLTTKQRNKLNQIRRVVEKISQIKIYNPKLLERLVQSIN